MKTKLLTAKKLVNINMLSSDIKALCGSPNSLDIVMNLCEQNCNVRGLSGVTGLGQSVLSHHLKIMRLRGFIDYKRVGRFNEYYALPGLKALVVQIKRLIYDDKAA